MAVTNTTSITSTTIGIREGTQLQVTENKNSKTVGNYVTDISIQPYIKNRIVSFFAYNMRPDRRVHIFFDSVNVDEHCAPGSRDGNNTYVVPTDGGNYQSVSRVGNWGSPVYTDKNGRVTGQFNLPAGTFKTGERALQICDVDSLVYGNDAITTVSSAMFTASNITVSRDTLTLTTVTPELNFIPVSNTFVNTDTTVLTSVIEDNVTILPPPPPPQPFPFWLFLEPVAQALTINTPNGESGIYATSIDLFFKQKSLVSERGVNVYICETQNGYPNGKVILPFSKVHKTYSEVNISENGTVATRFTFEAPVFLANKQTYAFVVRPDNNDQDYQVWTAELGDTDVNTGYQVFSQPVVGTAFYGATQEQWTALQTEYVKFTLNRARFNTQKGQAIFINTNTDFISVYNVGYSNSSSTILAGDYVYQSDNSTPSTANLSVSGIVNFYDDNKNILYVDNSTGNFSTNKYVQIHRFANSSVVSSPNNSTIVAYANTGSLYNPVVDALVPQLAYITPPGTSVEYFYTGTTNSYSIESKETKVIPGYEKEMYDYERIVASRTNELNSMSGKSLYLKGVMYSDSEFLSPAIDTVRNQQLVIKNDIDPLGFDYDEYFNNGNARSKYVSKIITLADGQDAEDLQIILTAFRPIGSDVEVWVKFLNGEDTESINQKTWSPLYNVGYGLYSDPSDPTDMKEYVYTVPSYYVPVITSGTVTVSGTTVTGTGTSFLSELQPGWFVTFLVPSTAGYTEQKRKIVSIASDSSLTVSSNFIGTYTSATRMYLAPPPTTAWVGKDDRVALTGTVSSYTTNNSIVGSGTSFTTQLSVGSVISVGSDQQVIVSIANNTLLSVGTPWSSATSGATAYRVSKPGLSYYNSSTNFFTSFKQFQIKIVLKSNDTSKVPIIDDLRALAMQL